MSMQDCKTFVSGVYLATTEGRDPMTAADAAITLREWNREGLNDIPEDLTPELLAALWNEIVNAHRAKDADAGLAFFCFGNGIVVVDRRRQEHGDYKRIAHIDACGAVKLYDDNIPPVSLNAIAYHAITQAEEFRRRFLRLHEWAALDEVYSRMTLAQHFEYTCQGGTDREYMLSLYIRLTCENLGYTVLQPSA